MKYVVSGDVVLSRPLEGPLSAHIGAFAQWSRDHFSKTLLLFAAGRARVDGRR